MAWGNCRIRHGDETKQNKQEIKQERKEQQTIFNLPLKNFNI